MTCQEVLEMLAARAPENCTRGERAAIHLHLRGCTDCLTTLRNAAEYLTARGERLPPEAYVAAIARSEKDRIDPEWPAELGGRGAPPAGEKRL
jgi:hypothetical protein